MYSETVACVTTTINATVVLTPKSALTSMLVFENKVSSASTSSLSIAVSILPFSS